ncbi:hypothetical protein BPNSA17_21190 [Bordetella petrii]
MEKPPGVDSICRDYRLGGLDIRVAARLPQPERGIDRASVRGPLFDMQRISKFTQIILDAEEAATLS